METFNSYGKIPRLFKDCIITEKLDGTNALIYVANNVVMAGGRHRWLTVDADNFGFAHWVDANKEDLLELGDGYHWGEWWGKGINRGYQTVGKQFSLFDAIRWNPSVLKPRCCRVVPILYQGIFSTQICEEMLAYLTQMGSVAAPGFGNPEGIVVYHTAARARFKVTLRDDTKPKGIDDA